MENQDLPNLKTKPFVTRAECAEYLTGEGFPISKMQLQKLASIGGGPEYQIFGSKALYRPPKALEWAQGRLSAPRRNTSEMEG